jgi:hypothetical protein
VRPPLLACAHSSLVLTHTTTHLSDCIGMALLRITSEVNKVFLIYFFFFFFLIPKTLRK